MVTSALDFSWGEYFQGYRTAALDYRLKNRRDAESAEKGSIEELKCFKCESLEKLRETVGKAPLTKAVLDLLVGMVDRGSVGEKLLEVIESTKGKSEGEVGYVGGNATTGQ